MIYIDSSVVLAQLLAEDQYPDPSFWQHGPFVSSRLLAYEVWTRINGRGLGASHADDVRLLLGRLAFLELAPSVVARPLDPFPIPVRTLDVLHLASIDFLRASGSARRSPHTTVGWRRQPTRSISRSLRSDETDAPGMSRRAPPCWRSPPARPVITRTDVPSVGYPQTSGSAG